MVRVLGKGEMKGGRWLDSRVDNVNDASGDQNVRHSDLCGVDEHSAVLDGDGHVRAIDGWQGGVRQDAAIADDALHDVVGQDRGDGLAGEVSARESRADGLEGGVAGCEDSHVFEGVDGRDELLGCEGAGEGGGGGGGGLRDGQDFVDDVDYAAG